MLGEVRPTLSWSTRLCITAIATLLAVSFTVALIAISVAVPGVFSCLYVLSFTVAPSE